MKSPTGYKDVGRQVRVETRVLIGRLPKGMECVAPKYTAVHAVATTPAGMSARRARRTESQALEERLEHEVEGVARRVQPRVEVLGVVGRHVQQQAAHNGPEVMREGGVRVGSGARLR